MRSSDVVAGWVAIDSGALPSVSEAFGASLGLVYGPWRGEMSFGYWLTQSETLAANLNASTNPNARGSFGKVAGSAKLCAEVWAPAPIAVSPCAGLELAWLSGEGNQSVPGSQTRREKVVSPEAGLLGIIALSKAVAGRLNLDVLFPLNRPTFGIYRQNGTPNLEEIPVHKPSFPALLVGAGVELHFR